MKRHERILLLYVERDAHQAGKEGVRRAMATRDMLSSGGGAAHSSSSASTAAAATRHRFSLLHLDEGEDYVADFVGLCKAPADAMVIPRALENTAAHAHGRGWGLYSCRMQWLIHSACNPPGNPTLEPMKCVSV